MNARDTTAVVCEEKTLGLFPSSGSRWQQLSVEQQLFGRFHRRGLPSRWNGETIISLELSWLNMWSNVECFVWSTNKLKLQRAPTQGKCRPSDSSRKFHGLPDIHQSGFPRRMSVTFAFSFVLFTKTGTNFSSLRTSIALHFEFLANIGNILILQKIVRVSMKYWPKAAMHSAFY
jgi:hypothetical protein